MEYQYYEFLAIDKPLTEIQMRAVRRHSSRAEITATSFVNQYNYGDFRGDERQFLTRYFDAMMAGRQEQAWADVERSTQQSKNYDQAVAGMCDLRDLAIQMGKHEQFRQRIDELAVRHASKRTLLQKMASAHLPGHG